MIKRLWYSRLNRKWYFILNWILLSILFFAKKVMIAPEDINFLWCCIMFCAIFVIRNRCNDIGLSNWAQVGIMIASFIPIISIIPHLYLLFKKGMDVEITPYSTEAHSYTGTSLFSSAIDPIKNISNTSPVMVRKLFIIVFCLVTLVMCLIPPYHLIIPKYGERFIGYGTIMTPPKGTGNITIDYKRLVFQEVILLVICGAGYSIITLNNKGD